MPLQRIPMTWWAHLASMCSWTSWTKRLSGCGCRILWCEEREQGTCISRRKSADGSYRCCCVLSLAEIQTQWVLGEPARKVCYSEHAAACGSHASDHEVFYKYATL